MMHFKNIFKSKYRLEEELSMLNETILSSGMDSEKYLKEKELLKEYEEI